MNLLCPNCQKMLQVPEQYAGQLMKCPLCAGTFTVPALPQAPAAPPPPAPPPPPPSAPTPASQKAVASAPAPSAPASTPSGYAHTRSYTVNPRVLAWLTPVCLVLVFILMFFTWVGMFPNGFDAVTQSGWQVAFNGYSIDEVYKANNSDALNYLTKDGPGVAALLIIFVLLLIPTLIIAVAGALIHLKVVPVQLPPAAEPFWAYRPLLVAGLCLALLIFLILQLFSGLPIEDKTLVAANDAAKLANPEANTPEKRTKVQMDAGKEYGKFNLTRTGWISLVLFFLFVATVASLLEWWVLHRGNQPVPRFDFHY